MAGEKVARKCDIWDCEQNCYWNRIYCRKHHARWKLNGDPLVVQRRKDWNPITFWQSVAITANSDKCWEWRGPLNHWGYGFFWHQRKYMGAHRYALILTKGDEPELLALHSCDHPPCCNPNHLRWGTYSDNTQDMLQRKRHVYGSRRSRKGLTDEKVLSIRADQRMNIEIAAEYGISDTAVSQIKLGKIWKHLL